MSNNNASSYQHSLTAAVAREHVNDLMRAAEASRMAAQLSDTTKRWTPRRRPAWWLRITTRHVTPRTA